MSDIYLGLDVGTTKVCALVGEVREKELQIIGRGITTSAGMRKGMVVNIAEAAEAIGKAIEEAEQTSGYELTRAITSMAGEHLQSVNNWGAVDLGRGHNEPVKEAHVQTALTEARKISLGPDRDIVHSVPRKFVIDGQEGVLNPVGQHGHRMSVEAHIITALSPALRNLEQCTKEVGVKTDAFVLNTLASAEAVLEPAEKEMGVLVADIGGGTTDIALYTEGTVWHTAVIPIGGQHFTNDISVGLRVPYDTAEAIKIKHGTCRADDIDPENYFKVKPFGEQQVDVSLRELAHVLEARAEEIFEYTLKSIKESGYDGMLPAGCVITGGSSQLRDLALVAERVLGVPARIARPRNLIGLVEQLQNPSYATSVGLLRWASQGQELYRPNKRNGLGMERRASRFTGGLRWFNNLLPRNADEEDA